MSSSVLPAPAALAEGVPAPTPNTRAARGVATLTALYRAVLLLLVLGAYGWRIQGLTVQSLWRDEVDAIYFALRDLPETLAMFVAMAQNGPLYFLTLRVWFWFTGASEYALRYVSVLAGTVAIPLLWQVARRLLTNNQAATATPLGFRGGALPLLAVVLLAINPYQLWYGQEGKMYALITALALTASWLWLQGISRGGWRPWLGYLLTVSCALYSHLLMIMIIPLHMIWFLIAWPQSRYHWRGYGLALAGLTLPYLPLLAWQWPMLLATERKTGFTFTPFPELFESLVMGHTNGLLPAAPWLQLLPMLFLAFIGVLLGGGAIAGEPQRSPLALGNWRRHGLLLSWLIFPVLLIYLLSLRQPVFTERYVIWIAPALMMLMALGSRTVLLQAGPLARPILFLLLIYTVGFWLYTGWQQKTTTIKYDLRGGVTYVAERRDPATLLILQIPHQQWAWQYYTGDNSFDLFDEGTARLGHWSEGLWTNGGQPDAEAAAQVDDQLRTLTAGSREVWLLSSETEMWDARHLVQAWLESHGELIEQADFHGVQARHYRLVGS
jgi:4-amino-4-deoxy-L-arabinose transferase-like glycosyltransferase